MVKRVAIVVQRYGKDILGGSESLARDIAICLKNVYDVEVLTTCAKEYATWANFYEPGEGIEDGIKVRRFEVDKPRPFIFKPWNLLVLYLPHTRGMEEFWMRVRGPYSSSLIEYVAHNKDGYDAFVFMTYEYATTYYCLPAVKERSVLVPAVHDVPFIRFGIFRDVFRDARAIVYLTDEEKAFTDALFGLPPTKGEVIGAPIKAARPTDDAFRMKYGIHGDFILYAGRLDIMKGVPTLLSYFEQYRRGREGLKLVLFGKGPLDIPDNGYVISPGFVPEDDLYAAMKAAKAVIVPSRFESFSYLLLEAMMCGTPAIVNEECQVLKGHCERSGGGMCYGSYEGFKEALDGILDEPGLGDRMGEAGRKYAGENYSLEAVGKKYIKAIGGLINDRHRPF